ncbi:MAG: DUF523 and DUF1722 domain-containing protein [Nitrospirota bacterium]|nr:DUF523 and DUF1722 domain-containing protein [Nitrospirota bacterium]
MMSTTSPLPIRIGISRCLLGEKVRYDGGHKRDSFLADTLGRHVEWVPVCPEVEAGLGTPREAMRLVGQPEAPRLLTVTSGLDHTHMMERFSHHRVRELKTLDLSGYVFKQGSPSCGVERVRIYHEQGMPTRNGVGLFARIFQERFPLVPVEEEGRLADPSLRDNFLERVFSYARWREWQRHRPTRRGLAVFHTAHKFLLLAHSRPHYEQLGRLVGNAKRYRPTDLTQAYGRLFMEALRVKTTVRKHANVLQHMVGFFKSRLSAAEREEWQEVLHDYHRGLTPLIVPLTLVKHYVRRLEIRYLADQVYLSPHPKELMLRNH